MASVAFVFGGLTVILTVPFRSSSSESSSSDAVEDERSTSRSGAGPVWFFARATSASKRSGRANSFSITMGPRTVMTFVRRSICPSEKKS